MWSDLSSPWTLRTSWVFQTWKSSPSPSSWSSSELELSTWEGTTQDCWLHRKTWYFQGGKTHFTSHAFMTNSTNLGLQAATCCCDIWKISSCRWCDNRKAWQVDNTDGITRVNCGWVHPQFPINSLEFARRKRLKKHKDLLIWACVLARRSHSLDLATPKCCLESYQLRVSCKFQMLPL